MEFYLSFIYAAVCVFVCVCECVCVSVCVCVSCRAVLAGMSTNLIRGIKALME